MKKQNVNNKLAFGKATVTELNNNSLVKVIGGSSDSSDPTVPSYAQGNGPQDFSKYIRV